MFEDVLYGKIRYRAEIIQGGIIQIFVGTYLEVCSYRIWTLESSIVAIATKERTKLKSHREKERICM